MSRRPYDRHDWQSEEVRRWGRRNLAAPEPGWFAIRKVKGGLFVAAQILHEPTRDPETGEPLDRCLYWHGVIDGEPDPDPRPIPTDRVLRIWTYGRRIDEAEGRYLLARTTWAVHHDPASPEARPDEPLDPLTAKPPF